MDVARGDRPRLAPASYDKELEAFLAAHAGGRTVPAIFNAVRNLTYASDGNRSPVIVNARPARAPAPASTFSCAICFASRAKLPMSNSSKAISPPGMPVVPRCPADLKRWIRSGGIRDFHCYVVWQDEGRETMLDATWPDTLVAARLSGECRLGWGERYAKSLSRRTRFTARPEDVVGRKARAGGDADRKNRAKIAGHFSNF